MAKKATGGRTVVKKKPAAKAGAKRTVARATSARGGLRRTPSRPKQGPSFLASRPDPAKVVIDQPAMSQTITFRVVGFAPPLSNCTLDDPGDNTDIFTVRTVNLGTDGLGQYLTVSFTYSTKKERARSSGSLLITIDSNGMPARRTYTRIFYGPLKATPPKAK